MSTTRDVADATADLLAEQRRAQLERCGIEVVECDGVFSVYCDNHLSVTFGDDDLAYSYANELADNMLNEGDYE